MIVEHYLNFYRKEYNLDYLVLRFANVYGPRQNSKGEAGVIAIFCDNLLNEKPIVINGDGKQTRDFVFVDDLVRANILGIEKNITGMFNIGTGVETDINTIFENSKKYLVQKLMRFIFPKNLVNKKEAVFISKKPKQSLTGGRNII